MSPRPEVGEIGERLAAVRARVAAAAERAGRDPGDVTLVGVSKRQPADRVAAAILSGLEHLGESYVQEARGKQPEVRAALEGTDAKWPQWHMIGRLQRNKAGAAVQLFDRVETVDRESLGAALDRRAASVERSLSALLQVNLSGEAQKAGAPEEALPALLACARAWSHLRVVGLMTIPAASPDPEASRAIFSRLRSLRDELRGEPGGEHLRELSMGMSADFEVAIEEGATSVRVGTAIFGPREE